MIIARAPFRLPLGGGGTDLPAYCGEFGASLVTASINKYMYVSVNIPATSEKIKLYYANTERVSSVEDISHNIIRESLKLHDIDYPIEIGSMADIDAGTGMGSSSVFTVALLSCLNTLKKNFLSPLELAEEACKVEIDLVGKPIGKQDQYASAVGGINHMTINPKVNIKPLDINKETVFELENRLLMFYTGSQRSADEVLKEEGKSLLLQPGYMHHIKNIGEDIRRALLNGNVTEFGHLLHEHWKTKRMITDKMSDRKLNDLYELALLNGALGGKIMGAGGGGFFLFCVKEGKRRELKEALTNRGLRYMDFRFEFEGCKVITNV